MNVYLIRNIFVVESTCLPLSVTKLIMVDSCTLCLAISEIEYFTTNFLENTIFKNQADILYSI